MYVYVCIDICVYEYMYVYMYVDMRVQIYVSNPRARTAAGTGGVDDILGGDVSFDVTDGSEPATPGTLSVYLYT